METCYERVRERDHGYCVLCWLEGQRVAGTEVHHIVPRSKLYGQWEGLRRDTRNLCCLCQKHHHPSPSRKENQRILRYLRERYGYQYGERVFRELLDEMNLPPAGELEEPCPGQP